MTAQGEIDLALALALRELRRSRGLTQEDFAHRAEITVAALARIERGQANPTWMTVRRVAAGLEISLTALGRTVEGASISDPMAVNPTRVNRHIN